MTPLLITWVLTVLAAVVVVLTRVRLSREDGDAAGRIAIPKSVLNLHTIAGVPALVALGGVPADRLDLLGAVGAAAVVGDRRRRAARARCAGCPPRAGTPPGPRSGQLGRGARPLGAGPRRPAGRVVTGPSSSPSTRSPDGAGGARARAARARPLLGAAAGPAAACSGRPATGATGIQAAGPVPGVPRSSRPG